MSITVSNTNANMMFDFHATALKRLTSFRWIAGSGFDSQTGNAGLVFRKDNSMHATAPLEVARADKRLAN